MKAIPPASAPDDAAQVLRQFRSVFKAVRTHFRQVEKEAGLGGAQVWALSLIRSAPGIGVNDIAAGMDIHQSTASNLVKTLLKKDMITVSKSPGDKRAVELRLTAEGRKIFEKVQGPYEGVLPGALARLDAATLKRLSADLHKLTQELQVDDSTAGTPLASL